MSLPDNSNNQIYQFFLIAKSKVKGAYTFDVIALFGTFDLPTYPNQILYYISLFDKIRYSLTY